VAVTPGPVVEHFNVIEDIRPGQIPGFIYAFSDPFIISSSSMTVTSTSGKLVVYTFSACTGLLKQSSQFGPMGAKLQYDDICGIQSKITCIF
jgi:hypothetical protein